MLQRKPIVTSLILLGIACCSTWLMIKNHSFKLPNQTTLQHKPDAFMEDATLYQYDQMGMLHSRLEASQTIHIPFQNSTTFSNPHFLIYTSQRLPWYISSKQGRSHHGTDWVYLWQNVVLHQPASQTYPATTIQTPNVTVLPQKSLAKTKANVTIIRPGTKIKSVGMQANLKTNVVKLLSHSHGSYEETIAIPQPTAQNGTN